MAAQIKLFQQLTWLVDTVYSFGPLTLNEIDRKWADSSYNYDHASRYGKRTFGRHIGFVNELFGIKIVCNRSDNTYYVEEIYKSSSSGVRGWIINTFALNNIVHLTPDMQDRVIFEQIPEGTRYLSTIVKAMQEGKQLYATYQNYKRPEPHSFLLAPYCLKVSKQRWYLVGKPEDHPEESEPRVYALDRVKDLAVTDKSFHLPAAFKPATFFENQFGIDRSKTKAEKIRVKVSAYDANFLISLPLHASQRVVESNDEYTVFEYRLAPTYDFIMELRKFGSKMEVLAPESLREEFTKEAANLSAIYK